MAARPRKPQQQEDIKPKIQAAQLLDLLQEYAITGAYRGEEVSASRVAAAKFLLNKTIGNAPAHSESAGADGKSLRSSLVVEFVGAGAVSREA